MMGHRLTRNAPTRARRIHATDDEWETLRQLDSTNFIVAGMFKPFATRDGNLITGQQQFSGAAAAELVVDILGR